MPLVLNSFFRSVHVLGWSHLVLSMVPSKLQTLPDQEEGAGVSLRHSDCHQFLSLSPSLLPEAVAAAQKSLPDLSSGLRQALSSLPCPL